MKNAVYLLSLGSILAAVAVPACGPPADSYTPVFAACDYRPDETQPTTLTPECKTALEAVIPYNRDSFANAPAGLLDQVTEAFQAIIGYPLAAPAENTVFGISNELSGALPLAEWQIVTSDPNPNKALFNYVMGQFDEIRYEPPGPTNKEFAAAWLPQATDHPRAIVIYNGFSGGPSFVRAATLAHEARHGDGVVHILCTGSDSCSGQNYNGVFECDDGMTGAHGMEIVYYRFLLHGSAVKSTSAQRTGLRREDVVTVGQNMADNLDYFIRNGIPALNTLLDTISCQNIDYDWVMDHEGLPRLSADDPAQAPGFFRWGS